jgi:hypothetical protein
MPGYVRRQLLKYKHVTTSRPQHCPYSPKPKKYGSEAQAPLSIDTSRPLGDKEIKVVQKIVGSILYYARAVDMTVLMALSTIASEKMKGTERTMRKSVAGTRLSRHSPQRNDPVSRDRYGHEHPF